jgi:hypothetical protein
VSKRVDGGREREQREERGVFVVSDAQGLEGGVLVLLRMMRPSLVRCVHKHKTAALPTHLIGSPPPMLNLSSAVVRDGPVMGAHTEETS